MAYIPQIRVKSNIYERWNFKRNIFNIADLTKRSTRRQSKRDKLLQRIVGSPDIYKQQMDGMGGATLLLLKLFLLENQLFQTMMLITILVKLQLTKILWIGGNCGNLSSAVGPFIHEGL